MGKIPVILAMAAIVLAIVLSGCTSPPNRVVVTVGPSGTPVPETITPSARPAVASPTVTSSGGTTTARGSGDQLMKGVRLGDGVYVVKWSGPGSFVSFSLTDVEGNGGYDIAGGRASGQKLLIVDGSSLVPGEFTLMVASDSGWAIDIARPDTSSPARLPLSVSCGEADGAVTKPFQAHAGDMWISYTLSHAPSGTGHVYLYDANTGASVYTRPITGDYTNGQSMASIPGDGVYIAQIALPAGALYGDITINQ